MQADLTCPSCFHALGLVELDAERLSPPCGACGVQVRLGRAAIPEPADPLPATQLALRSSRPARSKMRIRRDGNRLIARSSLLPFIIWFSKKIILGPAGYAVETRKGPGTTASLDQVVGFVIYQMASSSPHESPATLMWVSHAVLRVEAGQVAFHPLFAHFGRSDGEYFISVMNAHLEALRG